MQDVAREPSLQLGSISMGKSVFQELLLPDWVLYGLTVWTFSSVHQICKKQMINCEKVTGLFLPLAGRKSIPVHGGHGVQTGRSLIVRVKYLIALGHKRLAIRISWYPTCNGFFSVNCCSPCFTPLCALLAYFWSLPVLKCILVSTHPSSLFSGQGKGVLLSCNSCSWSHPLGSPTFHASPVCPSSAHCDCW